MQANDLLALTLSALALAVSLLTALRQLRLAKQANSLPVLVDLFREHRGPRLWEARDWAFRHIQDFDLSRGLDGLPERELSLVREIAWYYDNLGALVAHGVVDVDPVAGYLGGSVIEMWERMAPLVEAERQRRSKSADPGRWQVYFENLYLLVREQGPETFRVRSARWRLPIEIAGSKP
jgi:hypothetical protein